MYIFVLFLQQVYYIIYQLKKKLVWRNHWKWTWTFECMNVIQNLCSLFSPFFPKGHFLKSTANLTFISVLIVQHVYHNFCLSNKYWSNVLWWNHSVPVTESPIAPLTVVLQTYINLFTLSVIKCLSYWDNHPTITNILNCMRLFNFRQLETTNYQNISSKL